MEYYGTDSRDAIRAFEEDDLVDARGGNDFIFNKAEGTTLIGGNGNDQYRLFKANATIIEEEDGGIDTIWAWDNVTLPENVENLLFKKTAGWHALRGNELDNVMTSGDGKQAMAGLGGDDTLTGGGVTDSFHYFGNDGQDVITDFVSGEDQIVLWDREFLSFEALIAQAVETDGNTILNLDAEQSITLLDVSISDLSETDFAIRTEQSAVPDGAVLTFEDNFDSLASIEVGMWNTQPINSQPVFSSIARGARDHTYVDEVTISLPDGTTQVLSPFAVNDGVLSITAQRTPEALSDQIPEDWISGALDTHSTFAQTYGYFEVRAKVPQGQGFWPAFWMVPDDYSWPPELDILEVMGNETHILHIAAHSELWGDKVTSATDWLVPDLSENFHTFGMLWSPQFITFTFDGLEVFEVPTPPSMHVPMALKLNLAIGGWNGSADETTPETGQLEVDYVRAYEIPGLSDLPRSTDQSAFADVENGILNVSAYDTLALYGGEVHRVSEQVSPDLELAADDTATLVGDSRDNHLAGNALDNTLNGQGGDDTLLGQVGDDYLIGEKGDDILEGGVGADTLVGGLGDDTYVFRVGDGAAGVLNELILERPGEGFDTLFFADITADQVRSYMDWARWRITIQTDSGTEYLAVKVTPGIGGNDLGSYIERVVFADGTVWDLTGGLYLHGDDAANASAGTAFDDTMLGGDGNDTMAGMDGDDFMDGEGGVDAVYGWNGNDILTDTGAESGDSLHGEAGSDTLTGGAGIDYLFGGEGDDSLRASTDGDVLDGGDNDDTLNGNIGSDTMYGGVGRDRLMGGGGDDHLESGQDRDTVFGGAGNDVLHGGADRDKLFGGSGDDTLNGGEGADVLWGNAGNDVFRFHINELDGDKIRDFEAGERIEITLTGNLSEYSFAIEADHVVVQSLISGDLSTLWVSGIETSDIVWL